MILRLNNPFPVGKFEFTCLCGTWNKWDIVPTYAFVHHQHRHKFKCKGCSSEVIIWTQRTHWHIQIKEAS